MDSIPRTVVGDSGDGAAALRRGLRAGLPCAAASMALAWPVAVGRGAHVHPFAGSSCERRERRAEGVRVLLQEQVSRLDFVTGHHTGHHVIADVTMKEPDARVVGHHVHRLRLGRS